MLELKHLLEKKIKGNRVEHWIERKRATVPLSGIAPFATWTAPMLGTSPWATAYQPGEVYTYASTTATQAMAQQSSLGNSITLQGGY